MKKDLLQWKVEEGKKLSSFLKEKLPASFSAKAIKKAIESGSCRVNGRIVTFAAHAIRKGDTVAFFLPKEIESESLILLYEEEGFLIVSKPAGMASDVSALKALPMPFKNCRPVHRLDKDTSGVWILAKTEAMQKKLEELFAAKKILKRYLAIVDGHMAKKEGVIEKRLDLKKAYEGGKIFKTTPTKGKSSSTKWQLLTQGDKASLLLCEPLTGRTHQIRVHLSSCGHPILGDKQYGKKFFCPFFAQRHLLHAYLLKFLHPETQEPIQILAPLPNDFLKACGDLHLDFEEGLAMK